MRVWPVIAQAVASHGTCVLVTVLRTEGSTPREPGARMIVTPEGFHGTIGGGALEWKALARAQAMLDGPAAVRTLVQSLGPDLGQCCGGRVTLAFEAFDQSSLSAVAELAAREAEGPFRISGRIPGHPLTEQFGEHRRDVIVCGAGHVGRALMLALASLPFAVTLADPRSGQLPPVAPANVRLAAGDPVSIAATAPPGSFVFIMSHSHSLDLAIAEAALRNEGVAAVGLIGSATKRARFESRLREAGVAAARVAGMICPIGVPGIASKHPAAIAAAVAAQILMLHEAHAGVAADAPPFRLAGGA